MITSQPIDVANLWSIGFYMIGALTAWYLATSLWAAAYNLYLSPIAKLPGPKLRAAFHFPEAFSILSGNAYLNTRHLHEKYGKVVRIAPNAVSFTTAEAWKDVYGLKSDRTEFAKDPHIYEPDTNILAANQKDHTRMRRLYAYAFTETALLEQAPLLTRYFDLLVSTLKRQIDGPGQGRVNIMAYYNFTSFDIIGDLALGESFGGLESGENPTYIRDAIEAIKFLGVLRIAALYPAMHLALRLLEVIMPSLTAKRVAYIELTKATVEKRLDAKTDRKDIMTYVLRHNDDRGMSRAEIIDNSRTMLNAGSETTSSTLAGTTYYLLQNPDMLRRVQLEVRAAFKSADDITLRAVSTPDLLPYLDAILQESLRCFPPLPATLPRIVGNAGAVIDGYYVPKDTSVGVHQWSAFRSSANFAHPDTFDPERWMAHPPSKYRNDNKAAFQPFSLGPRGCIGKSLAYFELRSIMARMLWHFDMQLESESQRWTDMKEFTVWYKPPLWVKLSHRADL
ncbi:hypothetical protein XPA_003205 [Xanthoria parietina]